ncbi:CLUMA_CG009552, isoform A [Clunio marinus]|uniref:CLUMA_CG009552, isoform A n=1 Tax=Clunio marinus TaxID=568069 RepID=A0A1J1I8T0_9DIPT|nr:CLUMA_CG009552, isoform A [Clunio marinus]
MLTYNTFMYINHAHSTLDDDFDPPQHNFTEKDSSRFLSYEAFGSFAAFVEECKATTKQQPHETGRSYP